MVPVLLLPLLFQPADAAGLVLVWQSQKRLLLYSKRKDCDKESL
jgi:hypothetical protein